MNKLVEICLKKTKKTSKQYRRCLDAFLVNLESILACMHTSCIALPLECILFLAIDKHLIAVIFVFIRI